MNVALKRDRRLKSSLSSGYEMKMKKGMKMNQTTKRRIYNMKRYKVIVEVDENELRSHVFESGDEDIEGRSIEGLIEGELGWTRGILLKSVEEVDQEIDYNIDIYEITSQRCLEIWTTSMGRSWSVYNHDGLSYKVFETVSDGIGFIIDGEDSRPCSVMAEFETEYECECWFVKQGWLNHTPVKQGEEWI
jgi:hypothetical protein